MLTIVAPTLFPTKLEIKENILVYNHKRVLRQGNDQGAMMILGELTTSSVLVVEVRFVGKGRHQILTGIERLSCPRLTRAGVGSLKGVLFWQKCVGILFSFMEDKEEEAFNAYPHSSSDQE